MSVRDHAVVESIIVDIASGQCLFLCRASSRQTWLTRTIAAINNGRLRKDMVKWLSLGDKEEPVTALSTQPVLQVILHSSKRVGQSLGTEASLEQHAAFYLISSTGLMGCRCETLRSIRAQWGSLESIYLSFWYKVGNVRMIKDVNYPAGKWRDGI